MRRAKLPLAARLVEVVTMLGLTMLGLTMFGPTMFGPTMFGLTTLGQSCSIETED
jgi:hypothetical protein